jgi:hypothetical protein
MTKRPTKPPDTQDSLFQAGRETDGGRERANAEVHVGHVRGGVGATMTVARTALDACIERGEPGGNLAACSQEDR